MMDISLRYNSSSTVNSKSTIGKIGSSKKVKSVSHAGDSSVGVGDPSNQVVAYACLMDTRQSR